MAAHPVSKWPQFLSYVTFLINSSYRSKKLSLTPFEILGNGITSSFEGPLLDIGVAEKSELSKFWKDKTVVMAKIADVLRSEYKMALKLTRSYHNVYTMPVSEGDTVYFRIFKFSTRLAYLSAIMPRWKLGKVTKILGRTSVVIKDLDTGRLISRHLSDLRLHKVPKSYLNLYGPGLGVDNRSQPAEDGEDFGGVLTEEIMLQQEETALRAAADKIESKVEGSPPALRRSKRLADKNQGEKESAVKPLPEQQPSIQTVAVEAHDEVLPPTGLDAVVRPKRPKQVEIQPSHSKEMAPEEITSKMAPEEITSSEKSALTSEGCTQRAEMPIIASSGNPADLALNEFNLADKATEVSFGDINSVVDMLVRYKRSVRKN
jgi:hypothetical protein